MLSMHVMVKWADVAHTIVEENIVSLILLIRHLTLLRQCLVLILLSKGKPEGRVPHTCKYDQHLNDQ